MPNHTRRALLTAALTAPVVCPHITWAQSRVAPRADSPRMATDPLIISTGLSARWQTSMRQDLGWAAQFEAMGTRQVLAALEQGTVPTGLFLSHPHADLLDKKGLIYDRKTIARTDVLLVGPAQDVAGVRGETDAGRAIRQIFAACRAGVAQWHPLEADSALDALAHRLTDGQLRALTSLTATLTNNDRLPSYRLITRAQWHGMRQEGEHTKIWLSGGPQLTLDAQVACAFHARHSPGAKLLVSWLQWPLAQKSVKALQPAWRSIKA